jgi:hypothetical protein
VQVQQQAIKLLEHDNQLNQKPLPLVSHVTPTTPVKKARKQVEPTSGETTHDTTTMRLS